MAWISLLLLIVTLDAAELPRFLTKHASDTLRFISMDGRYAYVQKKPGVLGLVSSFRSTDFLTESNANEFIINGSRFRKRLVIESIPRAQVEMSLVNNHKILVMDYGNTVTRVIGTGRAAKLHLDDEWISYYDIKEKKIHVENLITEKRYEIKLSPKPNPFFIPEIELLSSRTLVYTDTNETGHAALISYDLLTQKSVVNYKSPQNATQLEICQGPTYLAIGEFPYDGVKRGSKIQFVKLSGVTNLTNLSTIYSSVEQDIGNIACLPSSIYFIKTVNHNEVLGYKVTEAAKIDLKNQNLMVLTDLKHVTQLIESDGRLLIPFRGEFFVLEGRANLSQDILRTAPNKEELQIDI